MSLTTIPNQPINFADPEVYAKCKDIEPELTISPADKVVFQFFQDRCPDAVQYLDPISPSDWIDNPGWTIGAGLLSLVTGNGGSDVSESSFVAVIGTTYEIEVFVESAQGDGVFVIVGGVQRVVNGPGLHKWTVTAQTATGASAVAFGDNSAIVITSFEVWEANRFFSVAFVTPDVAVQYDPINEPQFFQYIGQHVVFVAPLPDEVEGCFHIELKDECLGEPVVYCSQSIKVIDCEGTLMLRVCLDSAGLGFAPGYFTLRSPASLTNPVWEYETAEERLSNGFTNRYYIDRQGVRTLSIEPVSKHLHPFLAAMAMFDHFYIGEVAYSIDADTYQPSYGESQTGTGAVTLNVRKKMERVRRVLCDDLGPGCNPANDPICPHANAVVGTEYSEGTLFAFVEVFSNLGFFVSEARWFLNGVEQTAILIGGAPGKYALGAVVPGDTVRVVFVDNQSEQGCTDDRGTFTVQSPCELSPYALFFDVEGPQPNAVQGVSTAGFIASYQTGDSEVFPVGPDEGLGVPLGQYCVYPCDENGNPTGQWEALSFGVVAEGQFSFDLPGLDGQTLTGLIDNPVGIPASLAIGDLIDPSFTSFALPNLAGQNGVLVLYYMPFVVNIDVPAGLSFAAIHCEMDSIPSSVVDALCNALDATATGQASTFTGTAAATSASLANRNAYIANGNTLTFTV
jgi:hypothetical protein